MLKKRIAIGQIWQEQNTFSPILTEMSNFEQNGLYFGSEIIEKFSAVNELGGFIHASEEYEDIEIIPTIRAWAWPSGKVKKQVYKVLKNNLINAIKASLPLDGVLLSLHGSMVAENVYDVEGDILETIHKDISPDIPIAVSLDLHANITEKIVKHSVFIEGYHTCPHIDLFRTGKKTAEVFFSIINGNLNPEICCIKIPMITPADLHDSTYGPFKELFQSIDTIEKEKGVCGVSLFSVQPWLDVPELGWNVIVYVDSDPDKAKSYAEKISKLAWKLRTKFFIKKTSIELAIEEVKKVKHGLIVISDSDSTTSGATGDNTCVLKELIKQKIDFPALLSIVDPQVVKEALFAGIGNKIICEIGGKQDNVYSEPVRIEAVIKKFTDGHFVIKGGHIGTISVDMGNTVVLKTGTIDILVSEKIGPVYEQTVYKHAGLDPQDYRVVVVKSPVGFRAAYEPIAAKIILVDCPGFSASDLSIYKYENILHPTYPFDKEISW
ncbi:MAG: M81 family metallopeptidase [Bacteroidetes bacterium]|nr:M81 family metallopeptidase [Bacteroidota bacterium]